MGQLTVKRAAEQERQPYMDATGIPRQMRMEFEARSGLSFDDVRVHYNSDRPSAVKALAYTQGTQVYIKPGAERHLRHELGHVVQQKQGRVAPTTLVNGQLLNNSPRLEREADAWAAASAYPAAAGPLIQRRAAEGGRVIQRVGEVDAIEATISPQPIRRGNRRDSISETGGRSVHMVSCFLRWFNDWFRDVFCRDYPGYGGYYNFVRAEAVKIIQAANCDDFATVTFAHIAQNTRGQWVYICHMAPRESFGHAFTITSQREFAEGMLPNDVDLDNTFVVDGWKNYQVATLRQFCDRENPYGAQLTPEANVRVVYRAEAGLDYALPEDVMAFIRAETNNFIRANQEIPRDYANLPQNAPGIFNFGRSRRTVDDTRPGDVMASYLRDWEDEGVRHQELDKMPVDKLGVVLPWLWPEQCAAYLRILWGREDRARIEGIALYLRDRVHENSRHQMLDMMDVNILGVVLPQLRPEQCAAYLRFLWGRGDQARIEGIALYLRDRVHENIRHQMLDMLDVNILGVVLPRLWPEQCAAYLRFLWGKGDQIQMGNIMNDHRNLDWVRDFINALPSWRLGLTKAKAQRLLTPLTQSYIDYDFV